MADLEAPRGREFPGDVWGDSPGVTAEVSGCDVQDHWGPHFLWFPASSSFVCGIGTPMGHISGPGRERDGAKVRGLCQLGLAFNLFLEAPPSKFCFSLIGQEWVTWPHLDLSLADDGDRDVAARWGA